MSQKRNWKYRRDGKEPPPITDINKATPAKLWKKKYECKRGKGYHEWLPKTINGVSFHSVDNMGRVVSCGDYSRLKRYGNKINMSYWVNWECEYCGKIGREYFGESWFHTETLSGSKKFDRFRYKFYETINK